MSRGRPQEPLLTAPRYVVCREDCKGMPAVREGFERRPVRCAPATEARWQPLKALKDKLSSTNWTRTGVMAVPAQNVETQKRARRTHYRPCVPALLSALR
jgi:hypothetical protein